MSFGDGHLESLRYPPYIDLLQQNREAYNQRLAAESETLFSNDGPPVLEVFEAKDSSGSRHQETINSADSLNSYIEKSGEKQTSRIFYIARKNSMSPLQINKEMTLRLLNHFEIFQGFLDLLFEFGEKDRRSYSCMTTFQDSGCISPSYWELCYGLNFVERHGRARQSDPWSVRRTGIYQKHNFQTQENTWCLLHPSVEMKRRLKSTYDLFQSGPQREPLQKVAHLHILFASHATENWNLYIAFLEETFVKMKDKALMCQVGPQGCENSDCEVTFVDSQNAHSFEEKVSVVLATLQSNYEALSSLRKKLEPYWDIDINNSTSDPKIRAGNHSFLDPLSFHLAQHRLNIKSLTSLLERIRGISGLFHRIHEFRNNKLLEKLLQDHRDEMKKLYILQHSEAAKLSAETEKRNLESKTMTNLARKSLKEAATMRKLTFIGSIFFLPTTTTATLFGMGYLHMSSWHKVEFDDEMVGYIFATLILTMITSVILFWCCRGFQQKQEGKLEDLERADSSQESPFKA